MPSGDERLSDQIVLGALTSAFPPELVDEVVAECGRAEQRRRLLPARVVAYFVRAMCLFSGQGYEESLGCSHTGRSGWAAGRGCGGCRRPR
ncbi:transposase domain-containing protein [Streptomyces sp. NPDC001093]|uniref:transposase domain-containing protein n=1 Tax=Streptomyces sp. NPDC001093 TaxID=3154376 RepID=UPI00331E09A7